MVGAFPKPSCGRRFKTNPQHLVYCSILSLERDFNNYYFIISLQNIDKLFAAALSAPEIAGIIVNPWHCTPQLDKELIRIIQPGRAD